MTTKKGRECINFDADWRFRLGDIRIPVACKMGALGGMTDVADFDFADWAEKKYEDAVRRLKIDESEWRKVDLPHDWVVEGDFTPNHPYINPTQLQDHGYLPVGVAFYRKIFHIPAEDLGRRITIELDGVFRNCTIWLNGTQLGRHESGYTSFAFDLTDMLRYGDEGENCILVRVDASEFEGWYYDGAGIYRHVRLVKTHPLHVPQWGTYVTTPEVSEKSALVRVRTRLVNQSDEERTCEIVSTVVDGQGAALSTDTQQARVPAFEEAEADQRLAVESPALWSPDTPSLYKVLTEVRLDGEVVDTYETTFGIRTIEFTPDKGFLLNGKHCPIKGTCVHQDFAGVGVALPDRLHEYKIRLFRDMGCNAYRCAHNPPAPEILDACDRLGMLVMDENRMFAGTPTVFADLRSLMYRDRNHPCVIMWSMENEEAMEGEPQATRVLKALVREAKRIDPTRPVTAAMNHNWNEGGYSDLLDVVGYNYGQRNDQDVNDRKAYPERLIVGSETNSTLTTRGIYAVDEEKGYCSAYPIKWPGWGCGPEKAWNDVLDNPGLSGIFVWTGIDYRGETTPYKWPCVNSHFGIMDLCGFPKDIYFYYRSVWTDEPMAHLFPHWNWPGREGEAIDVWLYSNCDEAELFLNGESLGRKEMPRARHLEWKVPYEPGELTARAYRGGELAVMETVETAGPPSAIVLEPDRCELDADVSDVCVVRVAVVDDAGRIVPTAANKVEFEVSGPGRIIGVGNGDPSSHEPNKASYRSAFCGRCLVIVQLTGEPGMIRVSASAAGLDDAAVSVNAK